MSVKTSFTKVTINFFYLIYYLRFLITKPLPLNHAVVYYLANSKGFFFNFLYFNYYVLMRVYLLTRFRVNTRAFDANYA
jgi:hypothetical protein